MSITTKTTKASQHPCGFCSTGGRHDLCPGGVLNGNQTEVVLCACPCDTPKLRCLTCNAREDINPDTWNCNDIDACTQRVQRRREEALRDLYPGDPSGESRKAREVKETRTTAPRAPKEGKCLCCGEATKGGLFLPGHDSRYLSAAVTEINEYRAEFPDQNPLEDVLEKWASQGISEALRAKLQKRVAA
ncbi:hypothetical protein SEA_THERESITA_35 [Microbacterium phage Theresita]|nr:hypothetical protein SEA_THERESITA_35 [Microbacterium phage Theresita]